METFLEIGTIIYHKALGEHIVLKQNERSFERNEELPRFDIISTKDYSIMEGCYMHNGAWDTKPYI